MINKNEDNRAAKDHELREMRSDRKEGEYVHGNLSRKNRRRIERERKKDKIRNGKEL